MTIQFDAFLLTSNTQTVFLSNKVRSKIILKYKCRQLMLFAEI